MRNHMLAFALVLAATVTSLCAAEMAEPAESTPAPAPALLRIPLIAGLYTVEAPASWHVEESGKDLTATFSKSAGAPASDGALIIAAPNPLIHDAASYNRQAAESFLKKFPAGTITKEESGTENNRPTHTIWFAFKAGQKAFLGWSRTTEFADKDKGEGTTVQAMALAGMGVFADFMQAATPIFASYELTPGMVSENTPLLTEVAQKILNQF